MARGRVMAYQLINRANPKRFGEIKQEIQKLELREVKKYLTTLAKAMEQLQDYEQQKKKASKQKNNLYQKNRKEGREDQRIICTESEIHKLDMQEMWNLQLQWNKRQVYTL